MNAHDYMQLLRATLMDERVAKLMRHAANCPGDWWVSQDEGAKCTCGYDAWMEQRSAAIHATVTP